MPACTKLNPPLSVYFVRLLEHERLGAAVLDAWLILLVADALQEADRISHLSGLGQGVRGKLAWEHVGRDRPVLGGSLLSLLLTFQGSHLIHHLRHQHGAKLQPADNISHTHDYSIRDLLHTMKYSAK